MTIVTQNYNNNKSLAEVVAQDRSNVYTRLPRRPFHLFTSIRPFDNASFSDAVHKTLSRMSTSRKSAVALLLLQQAPSMLSAFWYIIPKGFGPCCKEDVTRADAAVMASTLTMRGKKTHALCGATTTLLLFL